MLPLFFCLSAFAAAVQTAPLTKDEQLIVYMDTGKKLLDQRKYDEALRYFAYVAKQKPGDKDPIKQMAFVYYAIKTMNSLRTDHLSFRNLFVPGYRGPSFPWSVFPG